MVKNAGSKNKRGRLMKNMKSPNSGLIVSFSSTQTVLYILKLHNFTTQKGKYGLPTLLYGYKTSLSV